MKKQQKTTQPRLNLYRITLFGELKGEKERFTMEFYDDSAINAFLNADLQCRKAGIKKVSGYALNILQTINF